MSELLSLGQVVTTPLTPNSKAQTSATGDAGQDTTVQFLSNDVIYWTAMVSNSNLSVSLAADRGNDVVTFKAGLTVKFLPQSGGEYIVTVDGNIIDSGSEYQLTGKYLGKFGASGEVMRMAS